MPCMCDSPIANLFLILLDAALEDLLEIQVTQAVGSHFGGRRTHRGASSDSEEGCGTFRAVEVLCCRAHCGRKPIATEETTLLRDPGKSKGKEEMRSNCRNPFR